MVVEAILSGKYAAKVVVVVAVSVHSIISRTKQTGIHHHRRRHNLLLLLLQVLAAFSCLTVDCELEDGERIGEEEEEEVDIW